MTLLDYLPSLHNAATSRIDPAIWPLMTTDIARWVAQEGAGLDVSSGGELAIALAAGTDPAYIVLHGNAKPVDELSDAAAVGVGRIVVDSPMEIAYLSCVAQKRQPVLIRV